MAYPSCVVSPELRQGEVDELLLRFTCYVAVCCTVYGASYESVTTEHYFSLVSQLRPDMVKKLKNNGTGNLPKDIQRRKTEHLTASANDAFATIRITAKDNTLECYGAVSYTHLDVYKRQEPTPGQLWLDRLLIDKKYQGKGYGKQAVFSLLDRLHAEYQSDTVYLSVYENNPHAIRLYQQIGLSLIHIYMV